MPAQTRIIHFYVCLGAAGGKECEVIMLLNHKGNTLIESLFALSIYLMIVVYFVGSLTVLNKAQLRFRYVQENSNKQELRIAEEGDDLQSKLKEALRS